MKTLNVKIGSKFAQRVFSIASTLGGSNGLAPFLSACHGLLLALLMAAAPAAMAAAPDLTNGEARTDNGDNNLGPTGMRGWMYQEDADTTDSRQILVTEVHAGSPAAGILAPNDVILGVSGTGAAPTPFTADARKSLAYAIADAEARNPATLQLLRWRAGVAETVTITLQYLGAYSATAPYNCPKSAAILEKGLQKMMAGETSGMFSLGSLALLAADNPSNPNNAARQTRARNEVLALIPNAATLAKLNSPTVRRDWPKPWAAGHTLIVLCEYYLKTHDPAVLPAIDAYVNVIEKGQNPFGSMGHDWGRSWPDGSPNGPSSGYGSVNSAAVPALMGLQMAKKCGSTHPRLDIGIERASRFFASYVGKGSIPYGEGTAGFGHSANGKSGAAALVFEMQSQRTAARDYFAKLATAAASEREGGHTGFGFNALWSPLGAAVGGEEAAASHFRRASWFLDLSRRWDGSFAYGRLHDGTTGYRSNWKGLNMSTCALLTYALPYRNLQITGKGRTPAGCMSADDVAKADLADSYNPTIRSTSQLIDDLASFSTKVRSWASGELAARTGEKAQILATLVPMANNLNSPNRTGAIEALGKIADPATAPTLVSFLDDPDDTVRYFAGQALRQFPREVLFPLVYEILAVAGRHAKPRLPLDEEDPGRFADAQLVELIFGNILVSSITGIDRNYLYPAIRMAALHPLGGVNARMKGIYAMLTAEDCLALADVIVDSVHYQSPGDTMFSAIIRTAGLDAMESRKFSEGVPLAEVVSDTDGRGGVSRLAADVLGHYAGSTALVEPDPRTIDFLSQFWGSNDPHDGNVWPAAEAAINAILADTNPVVLSPFKSIQSVTAEASNLTLPANWTTLRVKAYDYAKGDSRFTWRKVHGAGEVSFTPNGTAESKNTIALFDGTPGQYLFEVTMSDSRGFTEVRQTVAVTLRSSNGTLPSNNPPSAFAQTVTVGTANPSPITLTGSDPENLALNYQITTPPAHGTLTGTAPYLVYTSDYNYTGPDSLTFQVMDSEGQVATATIDLTVDTAAPNGLAVYEPFDYPAGALGGKAGTSEVGFAGAWTSPTGNIAANDSLTHGPLPTKGGKATVSNYNSGNGGSRVLSPSALADKGLLADGASVWMSAVIGNNPAADGSYIFLALANSSFSGSGQWIQNEGTLAGEGVGFTLSAVSKGFIGAARVGNASGSLVVETMANSDMDGNANRYYTGQYGLIVAKITWGNTPQDDDLIEIYQPNTDLRLPVKPIASITAQVNQSTFDTLTWYRNGAPVLDEIRLGADYRSVLTGSVPTATDTAAPSPNPIAFHSAPAPAGPASIRMVAATAFDPSGVEYYFTCTSGGGHDSGWQNSPEYIDTGLTPGVSYSYTVKARDLSLARNETASSTAASVTLPLNAQVPVVMGFSQAEAEALITERGFVVGTITTASSSSVDQGHVAQQNPAGGTSAAIGSAVNLVISETVQFATIPDLSGQPQSAANTALSTLNLLVGTVFTDYSETVPAGQIKRTIPSAGSQVTPGSTVNLVVSAGSRSTLLPFTEMLFEDFESPSTPTTYVQGSLPDNGKWVGSAVDFGSGIQGITDKAGGDFSASHPNYQAYALRYRSTGITTAQGVIGTLTLNTRYTVSFDVIRDNFNAGTIYQCELVAFNPGDNRAHASATRPGTVLASAVGNAPSDGSFARISFDFTAQASSPHLGKDVAVRFVAPSSNTNALIDNVNLSAVGVPLADTVPPLLVATSPEDEATGVNTHDVLILTFNEAVTPGSGSFTLRNVTDGIQQFLNVSDPLAVNFSGNTIRLYPSGGLLPNKQYTVFASLEAIKDLGGNRFPGIADASSWNFTTTDTDNIPPTLSLSNNVSSSSVIVGNAVIYLLTFSEVINGVTLDATDLGNAGTSSISIGAVMETSPGVFSVSVTPTSTGSLQLKVNAGAVISDLANNALNTTSAIADAETLNILPVPTSLITYDGNGHTGGLAPVNQEKQPNVAITLATNYGNLVKTGSTFVGWNTAADGTGTSYPAGATYAIDGPLTLYAHWELGTNGTWLPTTAGPFNWNDSANWSGGVVANGFNRTALFTPNIIANQTVNVDSATTIGNITFTDPSSSHNLAISGASSLTFMRTAGAPVIDVTYSNRTLTISSNIAGTNGLQKIGAGTLILSGTNNTYSGTTNVTAGTLQGSVTTTSLTPVSPFGSSTIQLDGGTLQFMADGNGSGTAETITIGNNVTVGGNATISVGRAGGSATNKTIALGNLSIGSNTLDLTIGFINYTMSFTGANLTGNAVFNGTAGTSTTNMGAITETGGPRNITKSGANTLRLTGNNTYTGTTTISGGTLEVHKSIASSSGIINNATLIFNNSSDQFYGNVISGSGSLSKSGTGTKVLFGDSSYTGTTTITSGTLGISKMADYGVESSIGLGTAGAGIALNGGALNYTGSGDSTNRLIVIGGTGTILNNGTGALNFTATGIVNVQVTTTSSRTLTLGGTNGGTISGTIQNNNTGIVGFTKTGSGTWTLQGNNTFTGTSSATGGGNLVLDYTTNTGSKLSDTAALTLGGSAITLKGGSHTEVVSATTLSPGASLITRVGGTGKLQMNAITRQAGGNLSLLDDTMATADNANVNGILGGWATIGNDWAMNTGTLDGAVTPFSAYTGALPITGTGSATANYTLSGGQAQTGTSSLNAFTLKLAGNGTAENTLALGATTLNITNTSATSLGGILYVGGGTGTYNITADAGKGINTSATNDLIINTVTGTLNISAEINTGDSTRTLLKAGAGTLVLGGLNAYTGITRVNEGTLRLTHNTAPGTIAGGIVVQSMAALELSNSVAIGAEALTLTGEGASQNGALRNLASNTSSYAGAITIGVGGARIHSDAAGLLSLTGGIITSPLDSVTFGGTGDTIVSTTAISGAGGVIKQGSGTLTLSGPQTYTGPTYLEEGTMVINGSLATSSIRFAEGATIILDTGSPLNAPNAVVDLTNAIIQINGGSGSSGQPLITAAAITGTPTLANPIPGYQLQFVGSQLLLVENSNYAAQWLTAPVAEADATEDGPYSASLANHASDVNNDPLTYAKVSGPAWLAVAPNGMLSGTPSNSDVGANSFTVSVSDGKAPAVEAILNITVVNTNDVPVWSANPIISADAYTGAQYDGAVAEFTSDIDAGTILSFSLSNGPSWLQVAADGTLSGTPTQADVGLNVFTVSVSDGIAEPVDTLLRITVISVNEAPVFTANPITGANAIEDTAYAGTLAASATDTNNDPLIFTKVSGPAWLSVAAVGTLSGTPTNSDVGANSFIVSVSDGIAAAVTTTLNIQVNQATYIVTYNGNGHTSGTVPTDQVKVKDTALTLATNSGSLAKTGFIFVGWNTFADGSGTAYTVGETYTLNAPLTLYAHWTSEADGTWLPTAGGTYDWGNATNWVGGTVATGADRTASFTANIVGDQTANLDSNRAIGTITFNDTSHNLTLSGVNTLTLAHSTASPAINVTTSGRILTISSNIAGSNGLQKSGAGTLVLSGNNTYTGVTALNAGILTVAHNNALGSTAAGSHTTIPTTGSNNNRRITVSSGITTAENFTVTGLTESGGGYNSPLYGAGTYSGTITLAGSGAIRLGGANWTGIITQIGTSHRLVLAGNNTVSNPMTINGADLTIANGTTTLNAVNGTGIGNTDIYDATLKLGVTDAIRTDGDLRFPTTTTARLDLNGKDQAIRGLVTSGGTNTREVYNNVSSTSSTLTVGNGGGDHSFAGVIRNNLTGTGIVALTKTGTGTQTLSGANTYTGATTVSAGTLGLAGGSLASSITVASGASLGFTLGSPVTSTSSVNFGAGTIKVTGTPTLASHTLMTASGGFIGTPVLQTPINGYVLVVQGSQLNLVIANTAPVWTSNPVSGANASESTTYTGTLSGSVTDANNDPLTFAKVSGPTWLSIASNGALSGTPTNSDVGVNSFTVSASDGLAAPVTATLEITVINSNDVPVFASNPITNAEAIEDAPYSGTLAGSATDLDVGTTLTYAKLSGPSWLIIASNGALSGTPINSDVGVNSFIVSVSDGIAAPVNATLNITVTNTNDAPVFAVNPVVLPNASVGLAYTGQTLAGLATDADAGDSLTYSKVSGPAWLVFAANGAFSGTPPSDSTGLNSFVVRATDTNSATADATLQITVEGLPLPWVTTDIGTGMLAGSASHDAGTFTLTGSGVIGGTSDRQHFTYQTLTGDGEIIAKISGLQDTGTSSRVGVMIRDTLAANSKEIFMGMTGTNAYRWVRRTATGGTTTSSNSSTGTVPNTWVRLVRSGTTITAYKSTNGTSWTTVGSTTNTTFASTCYIGIAVGSGSTTVLNTSQFSNVSVTP